MFEFLTLRDLSALDTQDTTTNEDNAKGAEAPKENKGVNEDGKQQ